MSRRKAQEDHEIQEIIDADEFRQFTTSDEANFLSQFIKVVKAKKGVLLLREGQIAKNCYYLFKGCIREYCLKDGGEITTEFYTVGDSLNDDGSKLNSVPSLLNWECVTDCIVSVFPLAVEMEMYKRFPRLETLCRIETEKKLAAYKQAVNNYMTSTAEERYENLVNTRPELFNLVPQYHIASYLGIKPESLSRIRNRIRNCKSEKN